MFLAQLREEMKNLIKSNDTDKKEYTMDSVYSSMRENILRNQVDKAIEGVKFFTNNGTEEISERELRKIINQCIPGLTPHH